jgi:flagellar basal-body rod modification protein FlgD
VSTSAISGSNPVAAADTSNSSKNAKDSTTTPGVDSGLGQNAFLQLLVTQLQHQDPLQPQDDTQFLAQLAQFTSLEQLTQINTSMQQLVTLAGGTSSSNSTSDSSTSKSSSSDSGTTGGN